MIEIKERLGLTVPPEDVWEVIADPHAVVNCIPGAELISENDDGSYDGKLTVQFGPMRVGFKAWVEVEFDNEAMHGRITARGKDNHGATRMRTEAEFDVEPEGADQSVVALVGEVHLTGRLASQIESGASMVVRRMTAEFTQRLTDRCSPAPAVVESVELAVPMGTSARPKTLLQRIADWFRRLKPGGRRSEVGPS